MDAPEIPDELTGQIDELLSHSEVIVAVSLLLKATGCRLADAKGAIGTRFRERFPDQFATYRDLGHED